ncbi:MAG: hypothetical protein AAF740_14140 [Bacteroidota bacterium]
MKKRLLYLIFLAFSTLFTTSCTDEDPLDGSGEIPEGEIWATVGGEFFRFDIDGGLRPQDANGYAKSINFTNITRETSSGDFFGQAQIRILGVDLDDTTFPSEQTNAFTFTFRPQPNVAFVGQDGQMQVRITSFEDDVLRGTFSGTARNTDNPAEGFLIENGQFRIRLIRF